MTEFLEIENPKGFRIQFVEEDKLTLMGEPISFDSDPSRSNPLVLTVSVAAEGIRDGYAFYGKVLTDDILNILATEELEKNPSSSIANMKSVNYIDFEFVRTDDATFTPIFKTTIYCCVE